MIVVFFRGTVSYENLKTDFDYGQVPIVDHFGNAQTEIQQLDIVDGSSTFSKRGKIDSKNEKLLNSASAHKGFLTSYMKVREEVMNGVISCLARTTKKNSNNDDNFIGEPKIQTFCDRRVRSD